MTSQQTKAAALLGRKGGKAGKGAAKKRSPEHYAKMVAARKAKLKESKRVSALEAGGQTQRKR